MDENKQAPPGKSAGPYLIERIQTGVRMEKRILKVLKAVSEYYDMSLGDLLEGIVLHAFDGKAPFGEESLQRIRELKRIYHLNLDSSHSHKLVEAGGGRTSESGKKEKKVKGSEQK